MRNAVGAHAREPDHQLTLVHPRRGFAFFSILVGLFGLAIYTLVAISNGEGQGIGYYLVYSLVPFPITYMLFLQASCRVCAEPGIVLKHDLFTSRIVPVDLIEEFTGLNGLAIALKDGRELEF